MSLKKIILVFSCSVLLYSCAEYSIKNNKEKEQRQYFSSTGFALVYDEDLYKQKIIN